MNIRRLLMLFVITLSSVAHANSIDPQLYHNNSSVQWTWAIMSLATLDIQGDEQVLDIGSGDGKITAHLSTLLPEGSIIGIDPSREAIEFACEHYQNDEHPNLAFEVLDARTFPFKEAFDVVTAFLSLHWVEDVPEAITQIEYVLKPGGKALITIPAPLTEKQRKAWIERLDSEKWKPYSHLFLLPNDHSMEEYLSFFKEAGMIPERMEVIKTSSIFHNRKELKDWVLAIQPGLNELPKHLLDEYFEARVRACQMMFPQAGDGRIYAFPEKIEMLVRKPEL